MFRIGEGSGIQGETERGLHGFLLSATVKQAPGVLRAGDTLTVARGWVTWLGVAHRAVLIFSCSPSRFNL